MNDLTTALISSTDWSELRVAGSAPHRLPAAISDLAAARDEVAADQAYWRVDNVAVVQGRVFDAAYSLVPILVSLLVGGGLSTAATVRVLDLLLQIYGGDVHELELEAGTLGLGEACDERVREGIWVYHACLASDSPQIRRAALDLVAACDPDPMRRTLALEHLADRDPDVDVQDAADWWLAS